jgi:plasmid stabilization system protein ParE
MQPVAHLRIFRTARTQLQEIYSQLWQQAGQNTAEKFYASVVESAEALRYFPKLGSAVSGLDGIRLRRLEGFREYLLFYRQQAEWVEIIALYHARRNWSLLLLESQWE